MRVFVTGATGFIGSATVQELIRAGHQVLGLARSDAGAKSVAAAGAKVHRGDLQDLESLRSGAAASDGVVHTAFNHDFSRFQANCEMDRRAIETIGSALAGSNRPIVITSGTALVTPGRLAMEDSVPDSNPIAALRGPSEDLALSMASRGVRVSVVRFAPTVHGDGDHGFVPAIIGIAREKGVSAYVGDGLNRWPAVHRFDAATLYRLALEKAPAGAKFHGIAEEGVEFRKIAQVIGRRLNLPVASISRDQAADHFGFLGAFAGLDCPASSKLTQERLGWRPVQRTLLADLEQGTYFKA
ncbi:MAG TPA: SDR family oxidoreductase [Tepidisphaeraceae bacterium]|nr:SDR family oxidoreductase [Tepidisphaeraceae bacterium]